MRISSLVATLVEAKEIGHTDLRILITGSQVVEAPVEGTSVGKFTSNLRINYEKHNQVTYINADDIIAIDSFKNEEQDE